MANEIAVTVRLGDLLSKEIQRPQSAVERFGKAARQAGAEAGQGATGVKGLFGVLEAGGSRLAALTSQAQAFAGGGLGAIVQAVPRVAAGLGSLATVAGGLVAGLTGVVAVGGAVGLGLAGMAISTAKAVEGLDQISQQTGVAVTQLSVLESAAKRNRTSLEDVAGMVTRLQVKLSEAKDGIGDAGASFEKLGIDVAQFQRLKPDEQLEQVAQALAGYADESDRARLKQDLLGRSAAQNTGFLNELATKGLAGLEAQAQAAGTALSEAAVEDSRKFNSALTELGEAATGLQISLGTPFIKTVTAAVQALTGLVEPTKAIREEIERIKGVTGTAIPGAAPAGPKIPIGTIKPTTGQAVDALAAGGGTVKITTDPSKARVPGQAPPVAQQAEAIAERIGPERTAFLKTLVGAADEAFVAFDKLMRGQQQFVSAMLLGAKAATEQATAVKAASTDQVGALGQAVALRKAASQQAVTAIKAEEAAQLDALQRSGVALRDAGLAEQTRAAIKQQATAKLILSEQQYAEAVRAFQQQVAADTAAATASALQASTQRAAVELQNIGLVEAAERARRDGAIAAAEAERDAYVRSVEQKYGKAAEGAALIQQKEAETADKIVAINAQSTETIRKLSNERFEEHTSNLNKMVEAEAAAGEARAATVDKAADADARVLAARLQAEGKTQEAQRITIEARIAGAQRALEAEERQAATKIRSLDLERQMVEASLATARSAQEREKLQTRLVELSAAQVAEEQRYEQAVIEANAEIAEQQAALDAATRQEAQKTAQAAATLNVIQAQVAAQRQFNATQASLKGERRALKEQLADVNRQQIERAQDRAMADELARLRAQGDEHAAAALEAQIAQLQEQRRATAEAQQAEETRKQIRDALRDIHSQSLAAGQALLNARTAAVAAALSDKISDKPGFAAGGEVGGRAPGAPVDIRAHVGEVVLPRDVVPHLRRVLGRRGRGSFAEGGVVAGGTPPGRMTVQHMTTNVQVMAGLDPRDAQAVQALARRMAAEQADALRRLGRAS